MNKRFIDEIDAKLDEIKEEDKWNHIIIVR